MIVTMLEFAIVLVVKRGTVEDNKVFPTETALFTNQVCLMDPGKLQAKENVEDGGKENIRVNSYSCTDKIDIIALFVFTISYFIFNCIYFVNFM